MLCFCLRRGREGGRQAGGAGGLPVLRWHGASYGREERVAVVLRAALFQDQAQIVLLHLL